MESRNIGNGFHSLIKTNIYITVYVKMQKPIFEITKEIRQENIFTFKMVKPTLYIIETKLKNFITKKKKMI